MKKLRPLLCAVLTASILFSAGTYVCGKTKENNRVVVCPQDIVYGDADLDSKISISDASTIQRYLAEYDSCVPYGIPEEMFKSICNVSQDNRLSIIDATDIQRYLAEYSMETAINTKAYSWEERLLKTAQTVPEDEFVSFDSVDTEVSDYLLKSNYSADDHSISVVTEYSKDESHDKPSGHPINVPKNGETVYIIDTISEKVRVEKVKSNVFQVNNLIPNRDYFFLVTDKDGVLLKNIRCRATGTLRMMNVGGSTFNIRDLGGWSCDGGTLKYGKLYRGCELNGDNYNVSINESQKAFFTDVLGICDEIDMRNNAEVDGDDGIYGTDDDIKSSALGDSVAYVRYAVAPYASGINPDSVNQQKLYRLLFKRVISDLCGDYPCYLHCMAGADRTGTVCALIEALCGVDQNDIDRDYELTSFAEGLTRVRNDKNWISMLERINNMPGSSFRDKAVSYALSMGLTIDEINMLRNALIDGDPEQLSAP